MRRKKKFVNLKSYSLEEIENQRIKEKIEESKSSKLKASIAIPSVFDSYTLACGYIRKWFFKRISPDTFNYIVINDGTNSKANSGAKDMNQNLVVQKPSLVITPAIEHDFNREGLDHNLLGLKKFIKNYGMKLSFMDDETHNIHLATNIMVKRVAFSFMCRFDTLSEQLDFTARANMACKMGGTFGENIDIDYIIPEDILVAIAKDIGHPTKTIEYKRERNKEIIANPKKFVQYMNMHSRNPIIYKFRPSTGRFEYYMRQKNIYIHIDMRDRPEPDSGENVEHIKTNFKVELRFIVDMPCPKFYAYYSEIEHQLPDIAYTHDYTVFPVADIKLPTIPRVNSKGWEQVYYSDIQGDEVNVPLVMDIKEMFEDDNEDIAAIKALIDDCILNYNSPSKFIELKLFNNGVSVDSTIEWKKDEYLLITDNPVKSYFSRLVMYIDREFINLYKIDTEDMSNVSNTIKDTGNNVKSS